jgi:GNAT superfamily N-acetyltransferase
MAFFLCPVSSEADLPRIVELVNTVNPEPASVETFRERYHNAPPGSIGPIVAVDQSGQIAGYAMVTHAPVPNGFWLRIIVDPLKRHQGIGSRLYNSAFTIAQSHAVTQLISEVRENCVESLQFAQHRDFQITRHLLVSRLYVANFDESRFSGVIEAVENTGIRFFTLADIAMTPDIQRKHHELYCRSAADNPATAGWEPPSFASYCQRIFEAPHYRADGHVIATDGDNWVGISALEYYEHTNSMHNAFTGVDRAYRGRHAALALKLLTMRSARKHGAHYVYTNNDSTNVPILTVNRKLGYQWEPGFYVLSRTLESEVRSLCVK